MSATKGPAAPAQPRTLRGRAIDQNNAANFPPNAAGEYDAVAGVPADKAGGHYQDNVSGAPAPSAPAGEPTPFKLGGM